jgi:site-specific DNA-methyltransferase (adenine-specific)
VHLAVTSPPYNVDMPYGLYKDVISWEEYVKFTDAWLAEVKRVLVPGGRMAINVGNVGRKPYTPLNALVMESALDLGFLMRGEIIWNKGDAVARNKTSWGSWMDCTNPVTRDCHEYIEVFSKDTYALGVEAFDDPDITKTEFSDWTISVWTMNPVKEEWHPAPFPIELPHRLIKLYTRPGMTVLDPFAGSGTTLLAAKRLRRKYIGFDIDPNYVDLASKRLGGSIFS